MYCLFQLFAITISLLTLATPLSSANLIIDADPGVDDAVAIVLALGATGSHRSNVQAITIVAGNGNVTQEALNCMRILELMNRTEIPIFTGSDNPLVAREHTEKDSYYGHDSFGDVPQLAPGIDAEELEIKLKGREHAAVAIARIAKQHKGNISLICLGPLTNLALAISLEPDLGTYLSQVVILGGNIHGMGNISPAAEFNFHHDPEAVEVVLSSGIVPVIVPWETLLDNTISFERFDQLMVHDNTVSNFLKSVEAKANDGLRINGGHYLFSDQVAVAIALHPQIATDIKNVSASVELCGIRTRGQMVVDWRPKYTEQQTQNEPNARIVTAFNLEGLITLISDAFNLK